MRWWKLVIKRPKHRITLQNPFFGKKTLEKVLRIKNSQKSKHSFQYFIEHFFVVEIWYQTYIYDYYLIRREDFSF